MELMLATVRRSVACVRARQ